MVLQGREAAGQGRRLLAAKRPFYNSVANPGEVPEWPIGSVSKTDDGLARPRVRIPPSPLVPFEFFWAERNLFVMVLRFK